jgi:DeoR family transcriptional regulator of aga operon
MLEAERQLTIISLIKREGGVQISHLSEMCGVSQNTIRRDLEKLEKDGVLRRTRGGAMLNTAKAIEVPAGVRASKDAEEKRRIGLAAAEMVNDDETIIIDAGTTTAQVCRALEGKTGLTVITNSLSVGTYLSEKPGIVGIVTGGIIRPVTNTLVGFPVESFLTHQIQQVDKAFIGVGAVDIENGFTITTPYEVEVKRAMMKSAKQVIVVAAASKIGNASLFSVCGFDDVDILITGKGIPAAFVEAISERTVRLVTV